MAIRTSKKDIIWNYLGTFVSLGSNFVILPFLMYFLESELLGLWYVFLSIGSVINLFDFGFSPTFSRNVAYAWSGAQKLSRNEVSIVDQSKSGPNFELLGNLIETCRYIYLMIAFFALFIMLFIGTPYVLFIANGLMLKDFLLQWLIFIIGIFFNLYFGYFTTLLRGVGAVSQYNKINIIAKLAQIFISIILMISGSGLYAMSIAFVVSGFVLRLLSREVFYKYNNIGEMVKRHGDFFSVKSDLKATLSVVWHNAWRDGLVSLSVFFSTQASILIATFFLTLKEVGIYSISIQLVLAVCAVSTALFTAYQPALQASHINNDRKKTKSILSLTMTVYYILFLSGLVAILNLVIPILKYVKPDTNFNIPIVFGVGFYYFLFHRHSLYTSYISTTNNVPYVKSFIISSLLGTILSIILIKYTESGLWGIIFGQSISQLIYNNWKWSRLVHKKLNLTNRIILKNGFLILGTELNKTTEFLIK